MKRRTLFSVMLTAAFVIAMAAGAAAGVLVDAEWVKSRMNDPGVVIVDVRSNPDHFDQGHIPGARKVDRHADLEDSSQYPPTKYPQQKQFIDLMSRLGIDNRSTVVAYDDKFGLFASRMLVVMELFGHDPARLKLLDGGLKAWQAGGNTLSTEPARIAKSKPYKTAKNAMLVSWCEVHRDAVVDPKPDLALHDARPADEYAGINIRSIRGGHIPNSVNVTGVEAANNKENHIFRAADDIRKAFEAAGITPDKTVYTYCHSADRAAHAYVVLKHILGFKNVKIYDGSWNEWAALTALPASDVKWAGVQSQTK
jgi:thiosulfate/3-mercaptopyruvate sulfurtransferase